MPSFWSWNEIEHTIASVVQQYCYVLPQQIEGRELVRSVCAAGMLTDLAEQAAALLDNEESGDHADALASVRPGDTIHIHVRLEPYYGDLPSGRSGLMGYRLWTLDESEMEPRARRATSPGRNGNPATDHGKCDANNNPSARKPF